MTEKQRTDNPPSTECTMRRTVETPSAATMGLERYRTPYRIGCVLDQGSNTQFAFDYYDAIMLAFDEALEAGVLDRPIELIIREVEGLPYNEYRIVNEAWRGLVEDERCIAMIGPITSENAIACIPLIEHYQVPTLAFSGALNWAGNWCFGTAPGHFFDEGAMMARWLSENGASKVAVMHEENLYGEQFFSYFKVGARRAGLQIEIERRTPQFMTEEHATEVLEEFRDSGADALAYMGWGDPGGYNMMAALYKIDWDPVRVMHDMIMTANPAAGWGASVPVEHWEGWAGVDFFDTRNPVFIRMMDRFEKRHGRRAEHAFAVCGYDMAQALAEAFSFAPAPTSAGLHEGLEQVRLLPAAEGSAGTYISFGPYDHRGVKGNSIVMRAVRNGKNVEA